MREPFQKEEKETYFSVLEKTMSAIAKLDIGYYLYGQKDPNSLETARRYLQNLIGYEVAASEQLKHLLIPKFFTESARAYRNPCVRRPGSVLKGDALLYELDTELASLYQILRPEDRSALSHWVDYHQGRIPQNQNKLSLFLDY